MGFRKLSFLQVEDLYDEVLSNAFHLSQDARLLLEHGSVGRARALAVLALEEAGKAVMIHKAKVRSFREGLRDPHLDATFWKNWRSHQTKLRAVHDYIVHEPHWFDVAPPPVNELLLGEVDDYLAELDRRAADGDSNKLKGFYVDIDAATGRTETPNSSVNPDDVFELLGLGHQVGWQLRLGDHIEFIASSRGAERVKGTEAYADYADGGRLARSRSGGRGWESSDAHLSLLAQELGGDSVDGE
ncbi:AbiV family abortive infection protein [Agreia bicolorata]|uniref:AbiV family abortive infection protein n=1 Tax=Agreia bicolorata TaxID=110935 RepID=UPI0009FBC6B3|nr:AbiV family abortive infection protein [Agreia bicolorata]